MQFMFNSYKKRSNEWSLWLECSSTTSSTVVDVELLLNVDRKRYIHDSTTIQRFYVITRCYKFIGYMTEWKLNKYNNSVIFTINNNNYSCSTYLLPTLLFVTVTNLNVCIYFNQIEFDSITHNSYYIHEYSNRF